MGYGSLTGSYFKENIPFDLAYNAFHLQRISDAINRKNTPLNLDTCLKIDLTKATRSERLYWIRGSFAELYFTDKHAEYTFKKQEAYFKKHIKSIKDAAIWLDIAVAELRDSNLLPNGFALNVKEGMQQ